VITNSASTHTNSVHIDCEQRVDSYLTEKLYSSIPEAAHFLNSSEFFVLTLIRNKALEAYIFDKIEPKNISVSNNSILNYINSSLVNEDELEQYENCLNAKTKEPISASKVNEKGKPTSNKMTAEVMSFHCSGVPRTNTGRAVENPKAQKAPVIEQSAIKEKPVADKQPSISILINAIPDSHISNCVINEGNAQVELTDGLTAKYINEFDGGTKTIPDHNGLKIRKNKKSKQIFLRVEQQDLTLVSFSNVHKVTEDDVEIIKNMYARFKLLRTEGKPWNNIQYLAKDNIKKLVTFNDLLNFYAGISHEEVAKKIRRMQKRYFSGEKGERKLIAYCEEQFAKDFLDSSNPARVKTDRDTVIKQMNAAFNKAVESSTVERPDFDNLVKNQVRNRSDDTSKIFPKLETYTAYLKKAFELGFDQLALNLILQESISTRKALTTQQQWADINIDELVKEVAAHQNKNRQYGRLMLPKQIKPLLNTYMLKLKRDPNISKNRKGEPIFLFESPQANRKGQSRVNFDNQLNAVRTSLCNEIEVLSSLEHDKASLKKEISAFTVHRLRDLSDSLLLDCGCTEAQKEKAAGRSTNNVARAYEKLSEEDMINLKTKKFDYIANQEPTYLDVINGLIDLWKV